MTEIIDAADWLAEPAIFRGEWQGGAAGAGICIIADRIDAPGGGPRLHTHPYAETFIIRLGRGRFTVGEREVIAEQGQIVMVPAGVPHKFANAGPGPFEKISIHEAGAFSTTWLE